MRSVIEEKTSRIIEVIISSVKPMQLMLGKIIGTSLAGVTQFTSNSLATGAYKLTIKIDAGNPLAGGKAVKTNIIFT